jgi:hypothetical protein
MSHSRFLHSLLTLGKGTRKSDRSRITSTNHQIQPRNGTMEPLARTQGDGTLVFSPEFIKELKEGHGPTYVQPKNDTDRRKNVCLSQTLPPLALGSTETDRPHAVAPSPTRRFAPTPDEVAPGLTLLAGAASRGRFGESGTEVSMLPGPEAEGAARASAAACSMLNQK